MCSPRPSTARELFANKQQGALCIHGWPTGQQPTYWNIVHVATVSAKIDNSWGRSMAHMSGA
jgi:hypothetical protein